MHRTPGHSNQNRGLGVALFDHFKDKEAKETTLSHLGSSGATWTPKAAPL